jgi:exopolysaccharide biosynthesis polyprenyl glycosylphosphotransferase
VRAKYKIVLAICDFLLICVSFSAALQLRGVSHVQGERWLAYLVSPEFFFFFVYSAIAVLIFRYHHLYKINVALSRARQLVAIGVSMLYIVVGLTFLAFFIRSGWIIDSRLALFYFTLLSFFSVAGYRLLLFQPVYSHLGKREIITKNIALVGASSLAKNFAIQMQVENVYGLRLVGFIDDQLPEGARVLEQYKNLGSIKDIARIVSQYEIDELIITMSEVKQAELLRVIDRCKATPAAVKVSSSLFDVIHKKTVSDSYFDIPMASLTNHAPKTGGWFFKRTFDIVGSVLGLIVLAIPFAVIGLIIKLTSTGPVFHKQVRVGKNGERFTFYKFRSMYVGSESDGSRAEKMLDFMKGGKGTGPSSTKVVIESNVTPFGRLLRKTSIDELPQLFNVLNGDMSLVGPRPCLPYEYDAYEDWHKRRLTVVPGCTGLWQVSSRSECGFDDMVLLDLYYIDNQSPWLDLQLIVKTIPAMIFGRGAK